MKKVVIFVFFIFIIAIINVHAITESYIDYFGQAIPHTDYAKFSCTYNVSGSAGNIKTITISGSQSGMSIICKDKNGASSTLNDVPKYFVFAAPELKARYDGYQWDTDQTTCGGITISYSDSEHHTFDFLQFLTDIGSDQWCPENIYLNKISTSYELNYPSTAGSDYYKFTLDSAASSLEIDGEEYEDPYYEPPTEPTTTAATPTPTTTPAPTPTPPPTTTQTPTPTPTPHGSVIKLPYTLDELISNGYLYSNVEYGEVTSCQLFRNGDNPYNDLLDELGLVTFQLKDGKLLNACVESFERPISEFNSKGANAWDSILTLAYSKRKYEADCTSGQSSKIFNNVIKDSQTNSSKAFFYIGAVCVSSDDELFEVESIEKEIDTMINNYYLGIENKQCGQCETILNSRNTLISNYNGLKRRLYSSYKDRFDAIDEKITELSKLNCYDFERRCKTGNLPYDPGRNGTKIGNSCEEIYGKFLDDLKAGLKAFRIIAPIMVAVYTTVEYLNAVTNKDADALKKANSRLINRFILLLILFFLPTFINLLLKLLGLTGLSECLK